MQHSPHATARVTDQTPSLTDATRHAVSDPLSDRVSGHTQAAEATGATGVMGAQGVRTSIFLQKCSQLQYRVAICSEASLQLGAIL